MRRELMRKRLPLLAALLCLVVASPALAKQLSSGANPNEPIIRYTARNWIEWRSIVDFQIKTELSGGKANGGVTWTQHWTDMLHALSNTTSNGVYLTENHEFYVDYILAKRRDAGLPDILGCEAATKVAKIRPDPPFG